MVVEGPLGHAYNEEAFRYLLAIEQKRADSSGRPFLLVLVDLKEEPGQSSRFAPEVASRLFSGLWLCLRETDFIGWYRERHVAGAVLAEIPTGPRTTVTRLLGQRVGETLRKRLPSDVARRLQVRAYHHPPSETSRPGGLTF